MADLIVLPPRGPGVVGNIGFELAEEVIEEAIDLWLSTKASISETEKLVIKYTADLRKGVIVIVEGFPGPFDFVNAGPFTDIRGVLQGKTALTDWVLEGWQFSAGDGIRVWTPSMGEDP